MTATFDRAVVCPFCGGEILLAECPIVATNDLMMARLLDEIGGASTPAPPVVSGGDQISDVDFGDLEDTDGPGRPAPAPAAPARVAVVAPPRTARGGFWVGQQLVSAIDSVARVVVAGPPVPPEEPEKKRFWQADRPEALPSAVELAADHGGSRVRPARACPRRACHHPLPIEIDDRDPFVVALVGNTSASKTTLLAALVQQAERAEGREVLGLDEFTVSERATRVLRPIVRQYRRGERTVATEGEALKGPLDFNITLASHPDEPIVLIINDIPGETYMDPDLRAMLASHIQWADAILFVVNPEEAPSIDVWESDIDQATVLNGIHSDLSQILDPSPDASVDRFPPLVVVVAKADVLAREGALDRDDHRPAAIVKALVQVEADDVVAAVERWPDVEWVAAAALPDDGPPTGVIDVFATVLRAMTSAR
ncbi:MAG TPA: hypothetical protein VF228_20455 [Iamia sp.]